MHRRYLLILALLLSLLSPTLSAAPLSPTGLGWPVPDATKKAFAISPLAASLDPSAKTASNSAQAQKELSLVQDRINQWHDFFKGAHGLAHKDDAPSADELSQLRAENDKLDALRTQAQTAAQE